MLIKSLRLLNFRQFKGSTFVRFSCDPERNVTIILGDNTFGKTTLLQAFNWCFYGSVMFDDNPDVLLNLEVSNDMNNGDTADVAVEICVIHDGTEYIITRTQQYECNKGRIHGAVPIVKVSYKQEDGQTESVRALQVDNVINNILPKDLSTYFFFDTERVRSISTRKDVAEAVKGILGLSTMDSAIKHIGSRGAKSTVLGKLYGALDTEGDSRAQEAREREQSATAKREEVAAQLENVTAQIDRYETRKEQLDAVLRDNQTTAALQKKKEDYEQRIADEKAALENAITQFLREFSGGALAFFAQPLLTRTSDFLREVKVDDKGVKDLTKPTILELIKRGRCICGHEICEGNDAYQHLMEELNYVPPESIGNTVRHYRTSLNSFARNSSRTYESLHQRYQEILRAKTRIQEWEDELVEICGQITG